MGPWRGGLPSEATSWRCGQQGTIARAGPEVACKLQSAHACQSRAHIAISKTAAPSQNVRTGTGRRAEGDHTCGLICLRP
jgi:hypothetical protein